MQKQRIYVMIAFLICCICSKANIRYKGSLYTTSKSYICVVALIGVTSLQPGEISLAHNGVLFLHEPLSLRLLQPSHARLCL